MKKVFFVVLASLIGSSAMAKEMAPYHMMSCERLIDLIASTEAHVQKLEKSMSAKGLSEEVRKGMQIRAQEMAGEYQELVVAANKVCR